MSSVLTISVEIELGWGVHDKETRAHLSSDGSAEREYLRRLLEKTAACEVPISFDVVGHLLLESCDGDHEGPYDDGWFDADPGTDAATDPLFYAPEVGDWIADADVDHELCTHTFSHVLCSDVSDRVLETELRRARELHAAFDRPVRSIVPPRHARPSNAVLRRNGIRAARYARETRSETRVQRFKELTFGPHPLWEPQVRDGVLETYCTRYPSLTASSLPSGQRETPAVFRPIPLAVRKRLHAYYLRRATRRAIESGTPLHLWCHLYDLSNEHQWEVLADYFEYLSTIPDDELEIRTMRELATDYATTAPRA